MVENSVTESLKKLDTEGKFLGVKLTGASKREVLEFLESAMNQKPPKLPVCVFTPTTEQIVMAHQDECFCSTLNQSTVNIPDTAGIVVGEWWLAKVKGTKQRLRQRVPGVDLMIDLVAAAKQQSKRVYLLGGRPGVAELAKQKLMTGGKNKAWVIEAGEGPAEGEWTDERIQEQWIEQINRFEPDLLLVAFGAPKQEEWVIQYRDRLKAKVILVVGGAFDMVAGITPRAPLKWRKIGLEWLWRLMLEPWRIKRQWRLVEYLGILARETVK